MKRTLLAGIATGLYLALAAHAQAPHMSLPNAPASHVAASNMAVGNGNAMNAARDASMSGAGVSLYTIVDLALRNSKAVHIAEAEQQHARGALSETRDAYIPNFSAGSGVGPPSYGFPLGNPTLFNVNSTSLIFSFSQRDYTRSTRAAWKAATLSLKQTRQQIILDATLDYIELDKTLQQITALNESIVDTDKLITVIQDRMHAGLESQVSVTRAKLTQAQIQLRLIRMQDHADELKKHLADLTGLSMDLIVPAASSIPVLPDLDFNSLTKQSYDTPEVQAADATADSKMFQYFGDKRQNYRPTIGFGFQYARFATFTGYNQYYNNFKYNNIEAGIQAVWPLFDPIRRDKAIQSRAEADRARRQAELTRIQSDESNFALWHGLRELEAQEQVAELQQQLAQDMLAATVTQMNQGSAGANAPPVTPQQAEQNRIRERTSYVDLQDAQFNVTRVKLNLLNAIGGLEDWAKGSAQSNSSSDQITSERPQQRRSSTSH